jgi:phosphatidylserine/phosphatidylglycerophosphate/cardiolipin synthase-like enzyme
LAAADRESYIERVISLAGNIELLDLLHKNLRQMMQQSDVLSPVKYTRCLENYYQQMESSDNFEYVFCIRNHAKVIIVDDELAYVGSANITPAGLGQGIISPGNFEAGILTNNPELVGSIRDFFAMVWDANSCKGCHRADQCE